MLRLHFYLLCFVVAHAHWQPVNHHTTFPQPGVWSDLPPFWQVVNQPPTKAFGMNDTAACLQNRTVYVLGTSTERQYLFHMLEMLGGSSLNRLQQKAACPEIAGEWSANCQEQISGIDFRFLSFRYMDGFDYETRGGFPFLTTKAKLFYQGKALPRNAAIARAAMGEVAVDSRAPCDNAVSTRQCLRNFFLNATSNDVLIFSVGLYYAQQSRVSETAFKVGSKTKITPATEVIDVISWLRSSASAFRSHIENTFPGQVFRIAQHPFNKPQEYKNEVVRRINDELWELFRPSSDALEKQWHTIDQYSINGDRMNLYKDHIHFPGKLATATLFQILNDLCPEIADMIPL